MERPLRWGIRCGTVGFGVALSLAALVYTFHAIHVDYELDMLCLMLWPASLGLMATENASAVHQVIILLVLSIMNAVMYFVLGFLAGLLPESEGPRSE
jgi:hypothetical protein